MLPPLPSFLPARPEGALEPAQPPSSLIPTHDPTQPEAGPSRLSSCAICSAPPKYTCPGCSTRTCSAACSKAHKVQLGCDGKRDPTKFVTLNTFSQGDWGGDYAYLEDGRRKIADWGKDLSSSTPGHGHGGQRGRGGHTQRKRVSPKVEGLRRQLESLGMDVEFMPDGMGRRKLNQSGWNPKTQSLHLTIQLSIPPSLLQPDTSEPTSGPGPIPTEPKIITHTRVLISASQPHSDPLPTLHSLLPQHAPSETIMVLPFHPSLSNPTPIDVLLRKPRPRLYFPPLETSLPVAQVLEGTSFVEFPTIQVWTKRDWEAAVGDGSVYVVPPSIGERGLKRESESEPQDDRRDQQSRSVPSIAEEGAGGSTGIHQLPPRPLAKVESEVKKPKMSSTSTGTGLLALGDYASDSDLDSNSNPDDQEMKEEEMQVTEEDIRVMRVLGAAAAADME